MHTEVVAGAKIKHKEIVRPLVRELKSIAGNVDRLLVCVSKFEVETKVGEDAVVAMVQNEDEEDQEDQTQIAEAILHAQQTDSEILDQMGCLEKLLLKQFNLHAVLKSFNQTNNNTDTEHNSKKASALLLYSPSSLSDIKAPKSAKTLLTDCNPVANNVSSRLFSQLNRLFKAAKGFILLDQDGNGDDNNDNDTTAATAATAATATATAE